MPRESEGAGQALAPPATEGLADPVTREPVRFDGDGNLVTGNGRKRFEVSEGLLYLTPPADVLTPPGLPDGPPEPIEMQRAENLRPGQREFRRLLRRAAARLPSGAHVVDIASNDAEFAPYFERCRYVAVDVVPRELKRAILLGRVGGAVVGDVRMPPLLPGFWDMVVSTNTLVNVTRTEAVHAVAALREALKPSGTLVLTVPMRWMDEVCRKALAAEEIREVRPMRNAVVRLADRVFSYGWRRCRGRERGFRIGSLVPCIAMRIGLVLGRLGVLRPMRGLFEPETAWVVAVRGVPGQRDG